MQKHRYLGKATRKKAGGSDMEQIIFHIDDKFSIFKLDCSKTAKGRQ